MGQFMLKSPLPWQNTLVFMLTNQVTYALDGNPLFWNDSSVNGFDAVCEGLELPTFFNSTGVFVGLLYCLEAQAFEC
jgi:hypothetical protein